MKLSAYKNLIRFISAQFAFSCERFTFIMRKAFALVALLVLFVAIDFGTTQITFQDDSGGTSGSDEIKMIFDFEGY